MPDFQNTPPRSPTLEDPDEAVPPAELSGPLKPAPAAKAAVKPAARPFRPVRRPPVPVLTVMDDGKSTGEEVRIRGLRFVIGRTEGDLLLPADEMVSARHAEIACQRDADGSKWAVTDLQSRTGLWLRVHRRELQPGDEFLVGQGRYRFVVPAGAADKFTLEDTGATPGWDAAPAAQLAPHLVELTAEGAETPAPLAAPESWIGREAGCGVRRENDPFTAPRHVRLTRDAHGVWAAENCAPAGLWLRVPRAAARECHFQIGEQRFHLAVPG